MQFVKNLSKKEYQKFWESTFNNHFMQSYEWGIAQSKTRGYENIYVGLKDSNGNLVAASLLLKKKTPFNMCYFYAPRGYTMDFSNKQVLEEYTKELKKFLQKENAIYLKLDPPLFYHEINIDATTKENGQNNYQIFNNFIHLGYIHKGFNKLYERNQPRYTFRTYFNKYKDLDEIKNNMSSSFLKTLKRSYNYEIMISESNEITNFYELIKIVSNKNNFHEYSKDYYQTIFDELKNEKYIKVFNASINPNKIITKLQDEIKKEKKDNRREKIEKDIEYFKKINNDKDIIIGSLICTYSKSGAWSLYIGNDDTALYTGAVNRLYYEFIADAFKNKYEYFDLFGVVGDPKTTYKNLAGIYEYKKKFGGDYIEFMGEFDLVNKKGWYYILPLLLKLYRSIKKN